MALPMFWDITFDWEYTTTYSSEPPRIKKKKANIFIKFKWFVSILMWKFNNRKWNKCRQKSKALEKYKDLLMKGYWR